MSRGDDGMTTCIAFIDVLALSERERERERESFVLERESEADYEKSNASEP